MKTLIDWTASVVEPTTIREPSILLASLLSRMLPVVVRPNFTSVPDVVGLGCGVFVGVAVAVAGGVFVGVAVAVAGGVLVGVAVAVAGAGLGGVAVAVAPTSCGAPDTPPAPTMTRSTLATLAPDGSEVLSWIVLVPVVTSDRG